MKNIEKGLTKIMSEVTKERATYYNQNEDQIFNYNSNKTEVQESYFNVLNKLFTNPVYTVDNSEEIIKNRRICLTNIFTERVRFLMNEKLNYIKAVFDSYGIICNTTADDIMKVDYKLFDLFTYDRYINNPISAGDCSLVILSVIYNNVMSFRDLSAETNGLKYDDLFNITNGILNIALLDLVHMFNTIYLEANEIYFPAGEIQNQQQNQESDSIAILEGEERAKALTEMGRPDLIETDVKVGRI